jgi:hypothetical protein
MTKKISIIVFSALIISAFVIVGIFGYLLFRNKPADIIEEDVLELPTTNVVEVDCLEVFGLECPDWMTNIHFDLDYRMDFRDIDGRYIYTNKIYFYNTELDIVQKAYFQDGSMFIIIEESRVSMRSGNRDAKGNYGVLIITDKGELGKYMLKENLPLAYGGSISQIFFSPGQDHVLFVFFGYEGMNKYALVDLNAGDNLLEGKESNFGIEDFIWSKDGKYFIASNHYNAMGGSEREEIILIDLSNGEYNQIFEIKEEEPWTAPHIMGNSLVFENNKIYFQTSIGTSHVYDVVEEILIK